MDINIATQYAIRIHRILGECQQLAHDLVPKLSEAEAALNKQMLGDVFGDIGKILLEVTREHPSILPFLKDAES